MQPYCVDADGMFYPSKEKEQAQKANQAWKSCISVLVCMSQRESRCCHRQVTTGSGELPAHIGHSYEGEDRFGRSSARKAEASRYAALGSSKPDSSSARSMHASPARLIITSGASMAASRDSPTARAASGELFRADSDAQRAQRAPSISLVTAPAADKTAAADRPLLKGSPALHQHAAQAGTAFSEIAPSPSTLQSQNQSLAPSEAQHSSLYNQQLGAGLGQQQATAAGSQARPSVQHAPSQMRSPFPSRVDSLSQWGRQGDAQQRSASPQSDSHSGRQRNSFEFEQGQYAHHAAGYES